MVFDELEEAFLAIRLIEIGQELARIPQDARQIGVGELFHVELEAGRLGVKMGCYLGEIRLIKLGPFRSALGILLPMLFEE